VPASVVQRGPNGTFAYVVAADKTASTRPIEVASIEGDVAVIAKGIHEGEAVVTDGQNQLRPGSRVAPRPAAQTTAKAQP
jgi:multidrug efflux system membrane fusion protein